MISSAELHKFAVDCARASLGDAVALINYPSSSASMDSRIARPCQRENELLACLNACCLPPVDAEASRPSSNSCNCRRSCAYL